MTSPNVLVVFLDSVRSRSTSLHGYSHDTTPFLNSFSENAVWYQHAYSPSTTSISSHLSAFTGLHEHEHQIYDSNRSMPPGLSIWEQLRDEHDYTTGLFTANPFFTGPFGLRRGFERIVTEDRPYPDSPSPREFEINGESPFPPIWQRAWQSLRNDQPFRTFANGIAHYLGSTTNSEFFIESFLDWQAATDGQWAAFINLMDAHSPYTPAPEYNRWADDELIDLVDEVGGGAHSSMVDHITEHDSWWRLTAARHLYDGAIRQADAHVSNLIQGLKDRDVFSNTLIVVSSDHGEAFGEPSRLFPRHHLCEHSVGVHEVQTNVPLVVSPPESTEGRRVTDAASLTYLPGVVKSAVEGEFNPDRFCGSHRDNERILVSRGFDDDTRYQLDDTEERVELPRRVYACYEHDEKGLVKYCKSGNRTATVRIYGPQEAAAVPDNDRDIVDEAFGKISLDDRIRTDEGREVSDAARQRLEQFGYI